MKGDAKAADAATPDGVEEGSERSEEEDGPDTGAAGANRAVACTPRADEDAIAAAKKERRGARWGEEREKICLRLGKGT